MPLINKRPRASSLHISRALNIQTSRSSQKKRSNLDVGSPTPDLFILPPPKVQSAKRYLTTDITSLGYRVVFSPLLEQGMVSACVGITLVILQTDET